MPETSLAGKVVVVGGASRNLGRLICETVAAEDAHVAVHYNSDSSAPKADDVVKAVEQAGGQAISHQADLTRVEQVEGLFDRATSEFGDLYASVNTAGMVIKKPVIEVTENEYDQMFAVNESGVLCYAGGGPAGRRRRQDHYCGDIAARGLCG